MRNEAYTAGGITLLTWREAVRQRVDRYFGADQADPELASNIVLSVIDDALHSAHDSRHRSVTVAITGNLEFTMTDDQPASLNEAHQLRSGDMMLLGRYYLKAAVALSTHAAITTWADGIGWYQELADATPIAPPQAHRALSTAGGTRVSLTLDAAFLTADAVISTGVGARQLDLPSGAHRPPCETCRATASGDLVVITDCRRRATA